MPNRFDFDFKEVYGTDFDKMSRNEKDAAILSQLYYMRAESHEIKSNQEESTRITYKHRTYFKVMFWFIGICTPALIGVIISLLAN